MSIQSNRTPVSPKTVMRGRAWVAPLCWFAVVFDGFDAVVLGSVLPAMTNDPALGMSDGQGTWVTTIGLVGMMLGALSMGRLTDKLGRRMVLILAVIAFSVFTFATGFATGPMTIGVLRFLAGLGLGGCLPTAISMVTEFAGMAKSASATTLVMSGYHVGAVLTGAVAIWVTQFIVDGWRMMFFLAGIPVLILVPLMYRYLPESPQYLASVGRVVEAEAVAKHYGTTLDTDKALVGQDVDRNQNNGGENKQGIALLLSSTYRRNTLLIWVSSFMGLLLIYGLNNYLPSIMTRSGYGLGNSLGFLVVLNVGSVIGLLVVGRIGDRFTPRVAAIISFSGSAIFLAALAIKLPVAGIYIMVFISGFFVAAAQNLMYAFTASNHPSKVRGTALGMSAGIGRLGAISGPLLGGSLLTAGLAYPWAFFAFGAVGAFGAVASLAVRTKRRTEKIEILH